MKIAIGVGDTKTDMRDPAWENVPGNSLRYEGRGSPSVNVLHALTEIGYWGTRGEIGQHVSLLWCLRSWLTGRNWCVVSETPDMPSKIACYCYICRDTQHNYMSLKAHPQNACILTSNCGASLSSHIVTSLYELYMSVHPYHLSKPHCHFHSCIHGVSLAIESSGIHFNKCTYTYIHSHIHT